ncbi:MAG: beta-N-acetylhexosaminidase [Acidobacteria bacterium 13_1_40CM_4_57_6]|nr:MAG: beta-N-acetylhexosaminidase [Acidobacteria bacterium 13_1_40CM_4_57_6]
MAQNARLQGLGILVLCALLYPAMTTGQQPVLNLMPLPASVQSGAGSMGVDSSFSVAFTGYTEPRLERAGERFLRQLARQTALPLSLKPAGLAKATLVVHTEHASKEIQEVGEDENYVLEVTTAGAKLTAPTPLGAMHGLQTFLQLVDVSPSGFAAPALKIQDQPRFPWRGLMIDSARHFIPLDVIRRNIDGMEAVKMNVFHWHLSENQGFRVESRKYPKLHELGSDALYYTQDEIRDLIAHARDRGIRVVPEFDMPGHSTAWFVGHPELASGKGPYAIERKWGIFDPAMDPANEKVYKFLDDLIGEMARIFSDHYFHIGGDEVNGKEWDANPKIQAFMKAHGIKNNEALQAYFSGRVQKLVTKHGKTVIGWDEVLVEGVPKDIVIQSWRGQASLAKAAKQGYRGILSNGYYLDLGWSAARHYAVDPMSGDAANLSAQEKQRILGGESCMWAEYVNPENVDSRIWPRNAAIAERLWSPQEVRDAASMYARLDFVSARLEWLGLTHRSVSRHMLQRLAGSASPAEFAALRTLADVLEPVKDYTREQTAPAEPTSATPMNRVVDAVPLESDAGRRFGELVDLFVAASCHDPAAEARLRAQLATWRDNDAIFQPLAQRSFLVQEVAGRSQDLAALGSAGLAALDVIAMGQPTADSWKAQQLASIDAAKKPKAQLLLIPAPAVQKLIEAVTAGGACASPKP